MGVEQVMCERHATIVFYAVEHHKETEKPLTKTSIAAALLNPKDIWESYETPDGRRESEVLEDDLVLLHQRGYLFIDEQAVHITRRAEILYENK